MSYKIISGSLVENSVNISSGKKSPYIEGDNILLNFISDNNKEEKVLLRNIDVSKDNSLLEGHIKKEDVYKFDQLSVSNKIINISDDEILQDTFYNDSKFGICTKKKKISKNIFQKVYPYGSNSYSSETIPIYTDSSYKENGEVKSEDIVGSDKVYSLKNPYETNDKIILSLGAHLEPLSIRNSIQNKELTEEAINSVKSNISSYALDARKRSICINNFYLKNENSIEFYEDGFDNTLDEGYSKQITGFEVSHLGNNNFSYNVIGFETVYSKPINIGFLSNDDFILKPFKDIDDYNYNNFSRIDNGTSILSGSDIISYFLENKINRNDNTNFNEKNTYTGTGYTYDQSSSIGTSSITFRDLME